MHNRFELLCRAGYGARGIVYVLFGIIAVSTAFGGIGEEPSSTGALSAVLSQPFGRILLGLIAIGLFGHVLWRLAQALLNADNRDKDAKGWTARAGFLASALANGAIAVVAARLALGLGGAGQGSGGEQGLTSWLMQQPFGRWLVGAVGVAIAIAGMAQIWRGIAGRYRRWIDLPARHEQLLHPVCAFGLAARGALFVVSGGFFVYAALTADPQRAGTLTAALDWVHSLPFGTLLYAIAALGLVAFGAYSGIEAFYRRMHAPHARDLKRAVSVG